MFVYAGIDEAGYGPMFGPLVIARTVFVLDGLEPTPSPPSLWSLLKSCVCKGISDKKGRIAVSDSKKLYTPVLGLRHIERGVLAFLHSRGSSPQNLFNLLRELAYDDLSFPTHLDWYRDIEGGPTIPLSLKPSELKKLKGRLLRTLSSKKVHLADICAAIIFEDRFNELVSFHRSKSGCAWSFVSGHLQFIWNRFGHHQPLVVVDRQGGRKSYSQLLTLLFPHSEVMTLHENPLSSQYMINDEIRTMHVVIQVESEKRHLPVALSSMVAKYIRELLMKRFHRFWKIHAPGVKSTFGYFGDGKRFLQEIEPIISKINIDRRKLIRCC